jgi:hypothetical protein
LIKKKGTKYTADTRPSAPVNTGLKYNKAPIAQTKVSTGKKFLNNAATAMPVSRQSPTAIRVRTAAGEALLNKPRQARNSGWTTESTRRFPHRNS